jgi:hypothetical protein
MTDIFRALCVELVELSAPTDSIPQLAERLQRLAKLADRARATLAQSVAPTNEELDELFVSIDEGAAALNWRTYARAVLARWGTPAIEPVPVSERLPEPEDCDKQGHVWAWRVYRPQDDDDDGDFWMQIPAKWLSHIPFSSSWSHWLPANALPIPEATND